MSILQVNEITGERGQLNEKGQTDYTRKFRVITDSAADGSLTVRTAAGVPRQGDVYVKGGSFDTTSQVKTVAADQDSENPRVWEVTVTYGAPTADEQQSNPNPLLRPSVLVWGMVQGMRAVWKDRDGKPITNSAGEYFDPPPEMDESRATLTVTRNLVSFNPSLAVQYVNAINSDTFLGNAPGIMKVAGLTAASQTENNFFYWSVTAEFHFRRDGWQLQLIDVGRNRLTDDGDLVPIFQRRADNGAPIPNLPVTDPVPLDGSGKELIRPTPTKVAAINFPPFKVYPSLPFASLGLI